MSCLAGDGAEYRALLAIEARSRNRNDGELLHAKQARAATARPRALGPAHDSQSSPLCAVVGPPRRLARLRLILSDAGLPRRRSAVRLSLGRDDVVMSRFTRCRRRILRHGRDIAGWHVPQHAERHDRSAGAALRQSGQRGHGRGRHERGRRRLRRKRESWWRGRGRGSGREPTAWSS